MAWWTPLPEPVTWTLPASLQHNGMTYATVTLRAPTGADIMKATAIPGASGMDVTLRLIEAISAEQVPYDALKTLPQWLIGQMSEYIDEFAGAPAPGPLEAWRAAREAAEAAEAKAALSASAAPVSPAAT
jgi:hypothetical protein